MNSITKIRTASLVNVNAISANDNIYRFAINIINNSYTFNQLKEMEDNSYLSVSKRDYPQQSVLVTNELAIKLLLPAIELNRTLNGTLSAQFADVKEKLEEMVLSRKDYPIGTTNKNKFLFVHHKWYDCIRDHQELLSLFGSTECEEVRKLGRDQTESYSFIKERMN